MQSKWFNLTENGWHDVVTMMLRDHQFEMVIEKLDRMRSQGMRVQPWLYDLTMYKFSDIGELDEVVRLLKQRIGDGESNISAQLWYHLIDTGSRALHVSTCVNVRIPSTDISLSTNCHDMCGYNVSKLVT